MMHSLTAILMCLMCMFQVYYLHLQPQTSQSQLPEPFSSGAAEPDQPCLQEKLHRSAEEKVKTSFLLN